MERAQQFCLRWNNYLRHIKDAFDSLRTDEDLVDVTLSCEGKKIRAHKMLLSACSTYFRDLFKENPCQHPVIIFKDVRYYDLEALVNFMYKGEVNVLQEHLTSFLNTADLLSIQGLSDGSSKEKENDVIETCSSNEGQTASESLPPKSEVKNTSSSAPTVTNGVINISVQTTCVRQSCPNSPAAKKRKCVGSTSSTVSGASNVKKEIVFTANTGSNASNVIKETNYETNTSDCELVEDKSFLKIENTDYSEQESVHFRDGQSVNFSDKTGTSASSDFECTVIKEETSVNQDSARDVSNADDKFQHNNPRLDTNQVTTASGPSLDLFSQEPLQDAVLREDNASRMEVQSNPSKSSKHAPLKEFVPSDKQSLPIDVSTVGDSVELCNDENLFDADASGLDFYYGCDVCKESKLSKKESGCPRCPICANFSAACSHLLKIHMKDVHGWFTVQRRFNSY